MNSPDQSQWDETTCNSAICQHPQCWAAVRRIERGHPRILDSSFKTALDAEDKLPMLTIVNISDSCFQAKRLAHRQSSEFTFTKGRSLLPRGSKLGLKCQGRRGKALPHKDGISHANRPPKVSILNLNAATLPFCEDARNMIVTWIPQETEKDGSLAGKTSAFPSWHRKKKIKKGEKVNSSMYFPGRQYKGTHLKSPGVIVPPPSPVHLFEQLSLESAPVWGQVDMLPQDLLKECLLPHGGKSMPCSEMKIQLAKIKKNLPLEKDRPISAISSKMYLTIHSLTLQRPSLRYPEHLRKLPYNLKTGDRHADVGFSGNKKQQQQLQQKQRKVKTPTKKQEAKKKVKCDPKSWHSSRQESDKQPQQPQQPMQQHPEQQQQHPEQQKLEQQQLEQQLLKQQEPQQEQQAGQELEQQQVKIQRTTLKHVSTEQLVVNDSESYMDFLTTPGSSYVPETDKPIFKDVSLLEEIMVESQAAGQEKTLKDISENMVESGWHPELKLLRILQATADEEDENQPSGAQSEEFQEA